jgi:TPR repeat protein
MKKPILLISFAIAAFAVLCGMAISVLSKRSDDKFEDAEGLLRSSDVGDVQRGLVQMTELAEAGNADAQGSLGAAYLYGEAGVEPDPEKAFAWFLRSAKTGDSLSQIMVGGLYASGRGTDRDEVEAVKWYRASAESGFPAGQLYLSSAYRKGFGGLPQDTELSLYWCKKAADTGDPDAQVQLGTLYLQGLDESKGPSDARKLFELAAQQGKSVALALAAHTYLKEQNYSDAISWLEKGVKEGSAECEYLLGRLHESGDGVQKDAAKALEYYRLAAAKGYEAAQNRLNELTNSPFPEGVFQKPYGLQRFKSQGVSR